MSNKLLLVDLESKQNVDLPQLDESYQAIIFVGANQNPPKATVLPDTRHNVAFFLVPSTG